MNHYTICDNPRCRFVLDLRVDGKGTHHPRFVLSKCPECGGKWSSTRPVSRRALGADWLTKLPR